MQQHVRSSFTTNYEIFRLIICFHFVYMMNFPTFRHCAP